MAEVKIVGTNASEMDERPPLNLFFSTLTSSEKIKKESFMVDFNQIDRLSNHQKMRIETKKKEDEEEERKRKRKTVTSVPGRASLLEGAKRRQKRKSNTNTNSFTLSPLQTSAWR